MTEQYLWSGASLASLLRIAVLSAVSKAKVLMPWVVPPEGALALPTGSLLHSTDQRGI